MTYAEETEVSEGVTGCTAEPSGPDSKQLEDLDPLGGYIPGSYQDCTLLAPGGGPCPEGAPVQELITTGCPVHACSFVGACTEFGHRVVAPKRRRNARIYMYIYIHTYGSYIHAVVLEVRLPWHTGETH